MIPLKNTDDQARALQKALNEIGYAVDPELVSKRVIEMHAGLVQEDEFLYTLSWFKKVVLAHKLDQFQIQSVDKKAYTIPDLFMVVNENGEQRPYYVEVKTSKEERLKWTENYYNGLLDYSAITGIPVLVAWKWKTFDIWTLVKLEDFEQPKPGANFRLNLNTAHKRNLMSKLLGDFFVTLPEQFALIVKQKKLSAVHEEGRSVWNTVVESVYLTGRDGKILTVNNKGALAVFHSIGTEELVEEDEEYLYYKMVPSSNISLCGQCIPVRLTELFSKEPVNWLERIHAGEFPIDYDELMADLSAGIEEGTVDYIIFAKPNYD